MSKFPHIMFLGLCLSMMNGCELFESIPEPEEPRDLGTTLARDMLQGMDDLSSSPDLGTPSQDMRSPNQDMDLSVAEDLGRTKEWPSSLKSWRKRLPFEVTSLNQTFTNVPVAIVINDTLTQISLDEVQLLGGDLRVVDEAGQELPYELESLKDERRRWRLWFKPPTLAQGSKFWLYYNAPSVQAPDPLERLEVWSSDYAYVSHMISNGGSSIVSHTEDSVEFLTSAPQGVTLDKFPQEVHGVGGVGNAMKFAGRHFYETGPGTERELEISPKGLSFMYVIKPDKDPDSMENTLKSSTIFHNYRDCRGSRIQHTVNGEVLIFIQQHEPGFNCITGPDFITYVVPGDTAVVGTSFWSVLVTTYDLENERVLTWRDGELVGVYPDPNNPMQMAQPFRIEPPRSFIDEVTAPRIGCTDPCQEGDPFLGLIDEFHILEKAVDGPWAMLQYRSLNNYLFEFGEVETQP